MDIIVKSICEGRLDEDVFREFLEKEFPNLEWYETDSAWDGFEIAKHCKSKPEILVKLCENIQIDLDPWLSIARKHLCETIDDKLYLYKSVFEDVILDRLYSEDFDERF